MAGAKNKLRGTSPLDCEWLCDHWEAAAAAIESDEPPFPRHQIANLIRLMGRRLDEQEATA